MLGKCKTAVKKAIEGGKNVEEKTLENRIARLEGFLSAAKRYEQELLDQEKSKTESILKSWYLYFYYETPANGSHFCRAVLQHTGDGNCKLSNIKGHGGTNYRGNYHSSALGITYYILHPVDIYDNIIPGWRYSNHYSLSRPSALRR